MKFRLLDSVATVLGSMALLATAPALAITVDPFPASGRGGTASGHLFTVGPGGEVFQLVAFIDATGEDLNGPFMGSAGQLGYDDPFADFDVAFSSSLSDGNTDITLTYDVVKTSGVPRQVTFLSYLDAQIDVMLGSFIDEEATIHGTLAAGQGYEIDEPVMFGDILDNLYSGILDNENGLEGPEDVSMALSFDLGVMEIGDSAIVDVMISEDDDRLGGFWIRQADAVPITDTEITYSGQVRDLMEPDVVAPVTPTDPVVPEPTSPTDGAQPAIPEPSSGLVFAIGALLTSRVIRRR